MPPKIPFTLAENTPGLILQVETREDSSLQLLVAEANNSILPYMETAAEESPVGRDVTEFFVCQRRIVDEWMKFIVKWKRKVPSQTAINRKEKNFICEYLEYFHHTRNWMMLTLTCSRDCRYAMVSLTPEPVLGGGPLNQIKVLKHTQWLIDELFGLREKLEYQATHDKLTGLYNRHYFWQEMHRLDRNGTVGLCLVLVDVNGLKRVNDTFGNQKGDEMLTEMAEILGCVFEGAHVIARIDGSQFAILITDTDLLQVEGLCANLDGVCEKTKWRMLPLSISWGIGHRRNTNISMPALFKLAEDRVYSQKLLIDQSHHSRMLTSLKETLKFCNLETADHMYRMENMVQALGKHLRLTTAEFNRLVLLAGMHDIGKVAIPDSIINKPAMLDEAEWLTMRTHSEVGYRIAMASQELSNIAMEIYHHHERWDGGGYPTGIAGESIPFLSRIISVVDTYEVMTHKRVYKEPVGHQDAIAELRRCAGTQFDPHVVELFLEVFGNLTPDEMERFTRDVPAACETDGGECPLLP